MVVRHYAILAIAALVSCGERTPKGAMDPGMVRCIPPGVQVLAGGDLNRLGPLGETIRSRFGAPEGTRALLLAGNAKDILVLAAGSFTQIPPTATRIAAGIVAVGSSETVASAEAQYRSAGATATPLLTDAERLAASAPLWAVVSGGVSLPLSGNLSNLNRLLQSTERSEIIVNPGETYSIQITGICRSASQAEQLERTIRGFVTLAKTAKGNADGLRGVEVHMKDRSVVISLTVSRSTVESLLH